MNRPLWKRVARRVWKGVLGWRFRHFRPGEQPPHWVRVAGLRLYVLPGVFDPSLHFTSGYLASYLRRSGVVPAGGSVLEIGTGSGLVAIAAAEAGARRVVAVDLNPAAVECAIANAWRHGLQERISVRQGDMFAPAAGERFDLIICNPPYFQGEPRNIAEGAYLGGRNYEWLDRFASEVGAHIREGGRALVVLGDAADLRTILRHLQVGRSEVRRVGKQEMLTETLYIFEMAPRH